MNALSSGPMSWNIPFGGFSRAEVFETNKIIEEVDTDRPNVFLLLEGFIAATRATCDDRVQALRLFVPGDLVNIEAALHGKPSYNSCAVTSCLVARFPAVLLRREMDAHHELFSYISQCFHYQNLLFQERIVSLGVRKATERLAHYCCEFEERMEAVGLVHHGICPFPCSQRVLSELLGLSLVTTNRSLQELRRQKLLTIGSCRLQILNRPALYEAACFSPGLLPAPFTSPIGPNGELSRADKVLPWSSVALAKGDEESAQCSL